MRQRVDRYDKSPTHHEWRCSIKQHRQAAPHQRSPPQTQSPPQRQQSDYHQWNYSSPSSRGVQTEEHDGQSFQSFTAQLEMEMEQDDSDDEETQAALVVGNHGRPLTTVSSPPSIRERTRAAHHNGTSASMHPKSPTASAASSVISSSVLEFSIKSAPSQLVKWIFLVGLGTALAVQLVPLPQMMTASLQTSTRMDGARDEISTRTTSISSRNQLPAPPPKIRYTCPSRTNMKIPRNRDDTTHGQWYDKVSQEWLKDGNWTMFHKLYRQVEFDNWGKTYEQVKEAMRDWKEAMYAPVFTNPKRVYTMYESACGVGLNLALTAEILHESPTSSYKRLELYGNEYVEESVHLANQLYTEGKLVEPYHGRLGRFCSADSLHLEHVPSNSFDLVFCGYITPEPDPLSIAHKYNSTRALARAYKAICQNETNLELVEQMQAKQEDLYRSWVEEMIRIALPGAPVIVEQVSLPLCEALYDWGGVARNFWNTSVQQWPQVDASSLVFDDDTLMKGRYHVFLRKLK